MRLDEVTTAIMAMAPAALVNCVTQITTVDPGSRRNEPRCGTLARGLQLSKQPRLGEVPVAVDRPPIQAEQVCDFAVRQSSEESEFHNPRWARPRLSEPGQ